jgi:hypothetical protein
MQNRVIRIPAIIAVIIGSFLVLFGAHLVTLSLTIREKD